MSNPIQSRRPNRSVGWSSAQIVEWQRSIIKASGGNPNDVPDEPFRFLRMREVTARTGLQPGTIYQRIAEGRFPRSIVLGVEQSADA